MLYLISLGLFRKEDISLRAFEAIKQCDGVYFENYTNFYKESVKELSAFLGVPLKEVGRKEVEEGTLVREAKESAIGLLIIGDIFSATTHISLYLEAKKAKVKVEIIHGSSVLSAIGETGLSLYRFGAIASIPFQRKNVKSPYEILQKNLKNDLHTLFLLDIEGKVKVKEGISYLLEQGMDTKQLCIGCWQLGGEQEIRSGKAKSLVKIHFDKYPQCFIVPAKKLHFIEEEVVGLWILKSK